MKAKSPIAQQVREEERRSLSDLEEQFIATTHRGQIVKSFSPSQVVGNITLAWYRGKDVGRQEVYEVLKKKYPRVAKYLLTHYRHFNLDRP